METAIEVPVEIKPQSCPNPLNVRSAGVLPVAILGTFDFDVTAVDPASIRLVGVAPLRSAFEDVATPFEPFTGKASEFDCTDEGPDGFLDLTLKFDTQEIVEALADGEDGEVLVLTLEGELSDGTPIVGVAFLSLARLKNACWGVGHAVRIEARQPRCPPRSVQRWGPALIC